MFSFVDYLVDYLEIEEISHKEFAAQLAINPSQLSMVLTKKRKLGFELMKKISMVTPFSIEEIVRMESEYDIEQLILDRIEKANDTPKKYINRYVYKELESFDDSIILKDIENDIQVIKDIMSYLRFSEPYMKKPVNVKFKSKHNKIELVNLWVEKCYRKTRLQTVEEYSLNSIEIIVNRINALAKEGIFDEKSLIRLFNENGVYLSIVEDLKGSKIRGAFRVQDTKPAVYISLKHKRPADIYFALLHELAHCKTDFNSAKSKSFISFYESVESETQNSEKLADEKAFDWMIDSKQYNEILSTFEEDKFNEYIKEYDIPAMFLAYRLAHDGIIMYSSKIYQENNPVFK